MSGTSPLDGSHKAEVDALPTTSDDNQRRGNAQSPPVHAQDAQGNFEVMVALAHLYSNQSKAASQALFKPWIMMPYAHVHFRCPHRIGSVGACNLQFSSGQPNDQEDQAQWRACVMSIFDAHTG